MANNTIHTNTGTYGVNDAPAVGPLMQGQAGVVMTFTMTDLGGTAVNLTGLTITGTITNTQTKATAALAGAIALVTPASGIFSWTTHEDDVGTAGEFLLTFKSGTSLITLPSYLSILETPAASTTFGAALVGVTVAEAAWLTLALATVPDASTLGSGGASDVDDLTTATGSSTNMLRVAAAGGLEYRTTAQVLGDIGAAAASSLANYLALAGGTMSGGIVMADQLLTRPVIKDYGESVNAIGSIGGGTQDIDLTLGNVVSGTVDTSTTTFTFSNPPASGTNGSFTLYLTNGGSHPVNWPASVKWAGGTAPDLTTSGIDILTFTTLDGGTTWYGFLAGPDMS